MKNARANWEGYSFLIPFLIPFGLFIVYPVLRALYMSLFDYTPYGVKWNGVANYGKLLSDSVFLRSLWNTFLIVAVTVPVSLSLSFLIASVLLKKGRTFQAIGRGAFYLPIVTSTVALSIIWKYIFEENYGLANYVMNGLGMRSVQWLSSPDMALWSLCIVLVTFSIGMPTVLYMAGLNAIPQTYYEVGEIEGIGRWRKLVQITLPLVKPTTLYNAVTGIIAVFQVFVMVMLMTGGGPSYATSTVTFLLYKTAFVFGNYGLASAIGVIMFLVIGLISLIQFKYLSTDVEF